jgi:glycosyltransferase involved in cell wall biosynthesis
MVTSQMKENQVILIKAEPLEQSPRIVREFNLLQSAGIKTKILCWNRDVQQVRISEESEQFDAKQNTVELKLKSPSGVKSVPLLLVWWCYVIRELVSNYQWQIAHAINFSSLFPALLICKITRRPLIYEILDHAYADQIVMPSLLRSFFIAIEKLFIRFPAYVIIVDELQFEEFCGIPNDNVVLIYDSPPDVYHELNKTCISLQTNKPFTFFFAGVLDKARRLNLDRVIKALGDCEDLRVVFAGYGDMVKEIATWSRLHPDKIQFLGRLEHREVLEESMRANCLFVLRDPSVPVNRYICGSKFLESTMCGKPILVSKGTSTAVKVHKEQMGLIIDPSNLGEIRQALLFFEQNPALCDKMGKNARKAYENIYGWHIMSERLLALYNQILVGS